MWILVLWIVLPSSVDRVVSHCFSASGTCAKHVCKQVWSLFRIMFLFYHVQLPITGNDMSDVRPKLQLPVVPCKRDYLSLSDQTSDKLSYRPDSTNIVDQSQVCTPIDSPLQSALFPSTEQSTIPYHSVSDTTGIISKQMSVSVCHYNFALQIAII